MAFGTLFYAAAAIVQVCIMKQSASETSAQASKLIQAAQVQVAAATSNATSADKMAAAAGKQAESMAKLANVQGQVARPIIVLVLVGLERDAKNVWAIVRIQNNGNMDAKSITYAVKFEPRRLRPKRSDYDAFPPGDFKPYLLGIVPPFKAPQDYGDTSPIYLSQQISPEDKGRTFYIWGTTRFLDAVGTPQGDYLICKQTTGSYLWGLPIPNSKGLADRDCGPGTTESN